VQPDLDAGRLTSPGIGKPARSDWFRLVWRAQHPRPELLQALGAALRALPLR
ncbi:MAG: hypothetical protein ACI8S6_000639, partial [Myxococcota bacterium]